MFLPADEKQFEFWVLRRDGLPNINIAKQFGVSRQAVLRALLSMDKRIEKTLLEMARANRIEVEKLDSKKGILFGRSVPFKFLSRQNMECKPGTNTKGNADLVIGTGNVSNCSGILQKTIPQK